MQRLRLPSAIWPVAALGLMVAVTLALAATPAAAQTKELPTAPEFVATYNSLADAILALHQTEENMVRSILAAAYEHADAHLNRAHQAITANNAADAKSAIEALAVDVGQLATEGDNSVGAVRKRLILGGAHHNAAGEAQGIFEEGYVIVTKVAKAKLLDSSRAIAQMAAAPKAPGLNAEWQKVQAVYAELTQPAK
jgi:hypothetical protein